MPHAFDNVVASESKRARALTTNQSGCTGNQYSHGRSLVSISGRMADVRFNGGAPVQVRILNISELLVWGGLAMLIPS
jgi:sarcosine oxidase gamma subunit